MSIVYTYTYVRTYVQCIHMSIVYTYTYIQCIRMYVQYIRMYVHTCMHPSESVPTVCGTLYVYVRPEDCIPNVRTHIRTYILSVHVRT